MTSSPSPELRHAEEFEREPVPTGKLKSLRSFIGMYAGEHVAGTEFMIGPLFLAAGVSAFDLLVGLVLGNLLAVLSWAFICAPIAVRLRLTLYYTLEKICGRQLVTIYSLANGVLFCILAGAMVSVSATAVGLPFAMPMPALSDWWSAGAAWVAALLVCVLLNVLAGMQIYFLALPGWLAAGVVYLGMSFVLQRSRVALTT